jgi:hypothetical protein
MRCEAEVSSFIVLIYVNPIYGVSLGYYLGAVGQFFDVVDKSNVTQKLLGNSYSAPPVIGVMLTGRVATSMDYGVPPLLQNSILIIQNSPPLL